MCVTSAIGDHYTGRWAPQWEQYVYPQTYPGVGTGTWPHKMNPPINPSPINITYPPQPSQAEFDALRREVEELKELWAAAKRIDEITGQPDCEMEDKIKFVRDVAKFVGVDLEGVL